ncbi:MULTISPECIES: flavin reductase family protein [Bacillus]|uniref:flavin reductase family protein n=1 Tax=Bacillus TaxID=1386 RepID=UPI00031AFF64|nr:MULTISPECIES: flavin reductase family protein [Bacillus]
MVSIDPTSLSERDNYKFLIGSIIPRPIAFVTSTSEDGTLNAAPFSFFNIVSSNPPLISISIQRRNGVERKDTARNIAFSKEFVVHIVDENIVEQVNQTAANLLPHESEIEKTELTICSSKKISTPGVKEAKIRMECVLERIVELGGDENNGCDFVIGKIVQYHIEDSLYDKGRINAKELNAVSRLAGSNYATLGKVFSIERPE